MIIQFNMKTPDIVDRIMDNTNIKNQDEFYEIQRKLCKWFSWGEYITIDYDTENDTMTVKKARP